MGSGYGVRCQTCLYSKEFLLGTGGNPLPFIDLDYNVLHHKTREQAKKVIGNSPIHDTTYENELIVCAKCNNLYSRPLMEIKYGDNKVFKTNKNCSKCKGEGEIISNLVEDIDHLKCPVCKNKTLEVKNLILWD